MERSKNWTPWTRSITGQEFKTILVSWHNFSHIASYASRTSSLRVLMVIPHERFDIGICTKVNL